MLAVETLVLPSEMVAESVVNNVQKKNFDSESQENEFVYTIVVALALG